MYGDTLRPAHLRQPLGPREKLSPNAKQALIDYQLKYPWLFHDELRRFIEEEWSVSVSRRTIERVLKEAGINRKKGQRICHKQSEELRDAWLAFVSEARAEQLVFIDESLYKLQTMWRSMAYAPIGDPARYYTDIERGQTYSILSAYTISGYLPCTGIKEGFYNTNEFIDWLTEELLPLYNEYPRERSIICLDNVSIHINHRVQDAIEAKGCLIIYLPPYLPDFNPIELTFSILKA